MSIEVIGVVGAGTMGSGIAQAFAQTEGYEVILTDLSLEFAQRGNSASPKGCRAGWIAVSWSKLLPIR